MLVLAMEFSKGARARRRRSLATEQEQPDGTSVTGERWESDSSRSSNQTYDHRRDGRLAE
jgi:hypothetical protein